MNPDKLSFEKHLIVSTIEQTVIDLLSANCPQISKQKLKQAMQFGAVWVTSNSITTRVRRAKKVLLIGDELHLYYAENKLFGEIKQAKLIADHSDFSVWNKPCGMFSQGTKWCDHTSICRWIELFGFALNDLPKREVYLVHRLDRATRGLILVAHSKKMANKLARLFESRQIEKRYRASVHGEFKINPDKPRITAEIDEREASTLLLESAYDPLINQTHLLLQLETGRKHQIRKHLAGLGFPIVGDRLYRENKDQPIDSETTPDLQLESCFLGFKSPINNSYIDFRLK